MKTWKEIQSVDELVTDAEKQIIRDVEKEERKICPYLKKLGDYFYHCTQGLTGKEKLEFESFNPIVKAKIDVASLQLYCMGEYDKCMYKKLEDEKRKKE